MRFGAGGEAGCDDSVGEDGGVGKTEERRQRSGSRRGKKSDVEANIFLPAEKGQSFQRSCIGGTYGIGSRRCCERVCMPLSFGERYQGAA